MTHPASGSSFENMTGDDELSMDDIDASSAPLDGTEALDADELGGNDAGGDPLSDGWDPPHHYGAGERFGTTAAEERAGESLDYQLSQELPDPDPYAEAERLESGAVLEADVAFDDLSLLADDLDGRGPSEDMLSADLAGDTDRESAWGLTSDDEGTSSPTTAELVGHEAGADYLPGNASAEEEAVQIIEP
jgi:hypothetical protein